MPDLRPPISLLLNFGAVVLVAVAILTSNDSRTFTRGKEDTQKEVDDLLRSARSVRIYTGIALILAILAFLLDGHRHAEQWQQTAAQTNDLQQCG